MVAFELTLLILGATAFIATFGMTQLSNRVLSAVMSVVCWVLLLVCLLVSA